MPSIRAVFSSFLILTLVAGFAGRAVAAPSLHDRLQALAREMTFDWAKAHPLLAPAGEPLIRYYRDRIADLKRFVADRHVVDVPAWLGDVQVVETSAGSRSGQAR